MYDQNVLQECIDLVDKKLLSTNVLSVGMHQALMNLIGHAKETTDLSAAKDFINSIREQMGEIESNMQEVYKHQSNLEDAIYNLNSSMEDMESYISDLENLVP